MLEHSLVDIGFRPLLDAFSRCRGRRRPTREDRGAEPRGRAASRMDRSRAPGSAVESPGPPRFHRILDAQPVFSHEPPENRPKGTRVSLFARRRDGSEFPVEINRSSLGPGADALVLVTMRDLTEWRRSQENLFREKEQAVITLESIGDAVITTVTAGRKPDEGT
jgi:hypothetical protein